MGTTRTINENNFLRCMLRVFSAALLIVVFVVVFNPLINILAAAVAVIGVHVFHYPVELFDYYWMDMGYPQHVGQRALPPFIDRVAIMLASLATGAAVYAWRRKTHRIGRFLALYALCYGAVFVLDGNLISLALLLGLHYPPEDQGMVAMFLFYFTAFVALFCALWRHGEKEGDDFRLPPRALKGLFLGVAALALCGLGWWGVSALPDKPAGKLDAQYAQARERARNELPPRNIADIKKSPAAKAYRALAEAGHANAQLALGNLYLRPGNFLLEATPTAEEYKEGLRWYKLAAEQGNAAAQYRLGTFYYNGTGVKKDYAEAVKWLIQAAESGNSAAQFCMGLVYENGHGVAKDLGKAYYYYYLSAVSGEIGVLREAERLEKKLKPEDAEAHRNNARAAWKPQPEEPGF